MTDLRKGMPELPKTMAQPQVEQSSVEADLKLQESLPQEENFLEEEIQEPEEERQPAPEQMPTPSPAPSAARPVAQIQKDEVLIEVEKVLEEGLGDFYQTLPPEAKKKFKQKGEEASSEISKMVRTLQLNFKRALQLVRDWLLTVPKVNKFFLEQEAKIKVDKINLLIEARKQDLANKT